MKGLLQLWIINELVLFVLSEDNMSYDGCQHQCIETNACHAKRFLNTCYYMFYENVSWHDGRQLCKSHHLHMAKLSNDVQLHSLALEEQLRKHGSDSAWLGGNSTILQEWTFINGVKLSEADLMWSSPLSETTRSDHNMCGTIILNQNHADLNVGRDGCYRENFFICHLYDRKGTSKLFMSQFEANWFIARSFCKSFSADLFYLNRGESFEQLAQNPKLQENRKYFIGLRHRVWNWKDGEEILYFNWKQGEPNGYENCLMIDSYGLWYNGKCSDKRHTICQKALTEDRGKMTEQAEEVMTVSLLTEGDQNSSSYLNKIVTEAPRITTKQGEEVMTTTLLAEDDQNSKGYFNKTTICILGFLFGLATLVIIIQIVYICILK